MATSSVKSYFTEIFQLVKDQNRINWPHIDYGNTCRGHCFAWGRNASCWYISKVQIWLTLPIGFRIRNVEKLFQGAAESTSYHMEARQDKWH